MERYGENKNPAEKVETCDASTQTENDNDIPTQCVIRDNVKKNQNDAKHIKLGKDNDSILSASNTDCSIAGTTTVPGCDDVINKEVFNNELPNNIQSSIEMILSRRTARLAELTLEDEVLMKNAETLRYSKQMNNVQGIEDVHEDRCIAWQRELQRLNHLNQFADSLNSQLENAVNKLSNPAVKHVRDVGTCCNLTEPYE